MAVQIFNLRNVPEDEADEICQLLEAHHIEFYETPAGRWGMSSPGLWVSDDAQCAPAKQLIAEYQQQRTERARQLYAEQKAQGQHLTLWASVKLHPLRVAGALLVLALTLYVSVGPFLKIGGR